MWLHSLPSTVGKRASDRREVSEATDSEASSLASLAVI